MLSYVLQPGGVHKDSDFSDIAEDFLLASMLPFLALVALQDGIYWITTIQTI